MLCEKILLSSLSNFYHGVLFSPPSDFAEISTLLQICAEPAVPNQQLPGCSTDGAVVHCPETGESPPKHRVDPRVIEKLRSLLVASVAQ